ncbi:MAG: VCBS repeat-containing protein [Saprospiraceae bacterium]|nr:VCBS repeat-containing protein [Saprospiraceae bacterium]
MRLPILFIFIMVSGQIICQPAFTDKTAAYHVDHIYGNGTAGGGVSLCDFDGDGDDDVSLGSSAGKKIQFYRNDDGQLVAQDFLPLLTKEIKSLIWVDFDNDGDKDLYLCVADDHNLLYENTGNLVLEDITLKAGLSTAKFTSFGACWGDYDRDGWLDLYYGERRLQFNGEPNQSFLYRNNGNKTFSDVTTSTGTSDPDRTPFCSAFVDVNNDRWPDIYTAHDRKRGNSLLRNNGNGSFESVADDLGAGLEMDGMSVSVGDYNNDGWQDIYVSNSETGNALFVNQQGSFNNLADEKGVAFKGIAWGTNFLDGDNDGDQDLYVSSMLIGKQNITSAYFTNDVANDTFTKGPQVPSDTVSSFNNATGDLNGDGFPDIVVSNSVFPTFVLENNGGTNHFLAITLQGVLSNKDGIGSLIKVYTQGRVQHKYTQCGLGFLAQNSNKILIGTGNHNVVDSITVLWPTGHVDVFTNVVTDAHYVILEGSTTNGNIRVDADVILSVEPVEDESPFISMKVTPNPTGTYLNIQYDGNGPIRLLEVFNLQGQKLQEFHHPVNFPLDISNLFSGPKIVRIRTEMGYAGQQIIIIQK